MLAVVGDRPPTMVVDGVVIYVSIHDAYHKQMRVAFKRRLSETHPDRPFQFTMPRFDFPAHTRVYSDGKVRQIAASVRRSHIVTRRYRTGQVFRKVRAKYERWLEQEIRWYAALGMEPPSW